MMLHRCCSRLVEAGLRPLSELVLDTGRNRHLYTY